MKILCTEKIEVTKGFFFLKTLSKTITERHVVCAHYSFYRINALKSYVMNGEDNDIQNRDITRHNTAVKTLRVQRAT
jgi:hypothetical protein